MTSFDAGSAKSVYTLDLTDFQKSVETVKQSYAELERLRKGMGTPTVPPTTPGGTVPKDTANQLAASQIRAATASRDYATALDLVDAALAKTTAGSVRANQLSAQRSVIERQQASQLQQITRAQQQLADSEVRAARASGDHGKALQLVDQQLKQTAADTKRYNDLLTRKGEIEQQQTRAQQAAPSSPQQALRGGLSDLQQVAGLAGIAVGTQQLIQQGIAAGRDALALDTTERSLRSIAGTQQAYNQTVALARENQRLFGGSLNDNLQNLTAFAVTTRRTGVDLAQLNDISKRLAILSPEQGASGAATALNELFSGNASSLQKRFEIPPEITDRLKAATGDTTKQLEILNEALNQSGITSEAVRGAVSGTAQAYNALGAAADKARTGIGGSLARLFENDAKTATFLLDAVGDAFSERSKADDTARSVALVADSYTAYQQRVAAVNQQIPFYIQHVTALTEEQYKQARAQEAATRAQQAALAQQQANTTATGQQLSDSQIQTQDKQQLTFAQQRVADLANDVARGYITEAQASQQLAAATGVSRQEAEGLISVQIGQIQANEQMQRGLQYIIRDQQDATQQTNELKNAQSLLVQISGQVRDGFITGANGAAILAQYLHITTIEAQGLIDKEIQLANVQRLVQNQQNVLSAQAKINQDRASGRTGRGDSSDVSGINAAADARAAAEAKAQRDQEYALGNAAQRARILQADLAKLRAAGATQAQIIEKQTEIKLAQQQAAEEAKRATKSTTTRLNQQLGLNDKIGNAEEDLQTRIQQIQRESLERQQDQEADYARDRARTRQDFLTKESDDAEDFERKRRKLLAEGKILEAKQAQDDFNRERGRDERDFRTKEQRKAEDLQTERQRQARETSEQIGDAQGRTETAQERAARTGERRGLAAPGVSTDRDGRVVVPDRPLNTGPLVVPGVPVGVTVAALAPRQINVAFQATVLLDGQKVGELVAPTVIEQVDEQLAIGLSVIRTSQSPGLQQQSVREVR